MLLFSVADGLYTAAMGASQTEAEARGLVEQVWQALQGELRASGFRGGLRGFRGGLRGLRGDLRLRLRRLLREEIEQRWGRPAAQRALRMWRGGGEQELPAPPDLLAHLETSLAETLAVLQSEVELRGQLRRGLRWATVLLAVLLVAAAVVLGVTLANRRATAQARLVALETLQARVQQQHLAWAVGDLLLDLGDPTGADQERARTLAQVQLLLEEVASNPGRLVLAGLPELRERLAAGQALARLRELALEAAPTEQPTLMLSVLLLEEVQAL